MRQFAVEKMTLDDFKTSEMTLKGLIDWLLESHIHFIICHIHQGLENSLWSIDEIYKEVQRLGPHPGFPNRGQVHCPIFRQDKYACLSRLPSRMRLSTFKIDLVEDMDMSTMAELVKR